jgi:hypothetical protein
MIDESFLKSNFLGRDGFVWWIGQVADPEVWRNAKVDIDAGKEAWGYRCKVRIIGYHSFDRNELADNDLPWAHILTSAADGGPAQGGFGKTPLLVGGESVVGFFLDGEEAQQPVIMSCFHRSPVVENVDNPQPFQPFTGSKGVYATSGGSGGTASQATRIKQQPEGQTKETNEKLGSDNFFQMASDVVDFSTAASLDLEPGFTGLGPEFLSQAGSTYEGAFSPSDTLFSDDLAEAAFLKGIYDGGKVPTDNGCGDNILAQITEKLQSFIGTINSLEQTALGFIDPIRNTIVDVRNIVNSVSRSIASLVKFVINAMRDNIFKLIGKLFKLLGLVTPSPIALPLSEAAKNIMNIIFCLFEKLWPLILDFLKGLLNGVVGRSPNVPRCAAEEVASSLINKLASMIDGALGTIMSGLDWLANGISSIAGALTGSLNIISQLLSFLQCDGLACRGITTWDPFSGARFPGSDLWDNILANMNVLNGLGTPDFSVGFLSLFGDDNTPFADCRKRIVNPQNQDDLAPLPPGVRFNKCIPPEVLIYGGNGVNARAKAVVSEIDGSIVSFLLCDPGSGYTSPPDIQIIDNSNHGKGAQARTTIVDGRINRIYIINPGRGYCQTNLTEETSNRPTGLLPPDGVGIGTIGIGTTQRPCLDVGDRRLSDNIIGINTDFVIERPGIGYTNSDTIQVGDCMYKPVLTRNGSIIGYEKMGDCSDKFTRVPLVSINTRTGQGAAIYPVIQFVPQFIEDNPDLVDNFINGGTGGVGINTIVNIVDCVSESNILVGYVNGSPYYGSFHIHMGRKMTGRVHTGTGSYIYDTVEESLGLTSVQQTSQQTSQETTTPTTGGTGVALPPEPTPTPTPTPTPNPTPTPTPNPDPDPPSSPSPPPSPPPSSGGGGYGY